MPALDLLSPPTTATRSGDGWLVTGHHVRVEVQADALHVVVAFMDDLGDDRTGWAVLPRSAAGVVVHASGWASFDEVRVSKGAIRPGL